MVLTLSILIAQAVTLQTSALQNTPAMKPATLAYFLLVKTTLTASWDRVTPSTGSITPPALFALMESASQGARATRAVRLDTSVPRQHPSRQDNVLLRLTADLRFVQKFKRPNFWAQIFTQ